MSKIIFLRIKLVNLSQYRYVVSFDSKFKKDGHSLRKYKCHDYANCKNKSEYTKAKARRSINRPAAYDELSLTEKNTFMKNDVCKKEAK